MMKSPRVTVLMATWNRADMISKAIESVRAQNFSDWELVVTDDGSTDNTPAAVAEWTKKEPRIAYTRSEVNQGISKNYNRGLRMARGEYVAMIDDDDPWIGKDKLAKQVKFLDENKEYVGCGGGVIVVDPSGREKYSYFKPEKDEDIRKRMLFGNPMANSTTIFRRAVGEQAGLYDETTRYSGDRDFWLKMGLMGKLHNFPEYFSYYTLGKHNTSIAMMRPHLKASLIVMKRYKDKYPNYLPALILNKVQYAYAFLPESVRRMLHTTLARLKRRAVG